MSEWPLRPSRSSSNVLYWRSGALSPLMRGAGGLAWTPVMLVWLVAGALLGGCDSSGTEGGEKLSDLKVQVDARPAGLFEVRCTQTVVAGGRQQTVSRNKVAPYELPKTEGSSISVQCTHVRSEQDAAVQVRILVDGEVEVEREETGAFAAVQASWPESGSGGGVGTYGVRDTGRPVIFDRYAVDGSGNALLDTSLYAVPSERLADTLQAGQYQAASSDSGVFFSSESAGGVRVRLFTPPNWIPGSSYFHFDTNSAGAMVPRIETGEAVLEPDRTARVLRAMGWPAPEETPSAGAQHRSRAAGEPGLRVVSGPSPERVCRHLSGAWGAPRGHGLLGDRSTFKPSPGNTVIARGSTQKNGQTSTKTQERGRVFTFAFEGGWPDAGKAALREAGRIWSEYVGTRDTIEVLARWGATDAGVASSAAPISYAAGFSGAVDDSTFYPAALANAITGEDLNGPDQAEIDVLVGSGIPWYYPADYAVPEGQQSFVSQMIHELAHGMGFLGTMTVRQKEACRGRAASSACSRHCAFTS